jgi:hypothetical protein
VTDEGFGELLNTVDRLPAPCPRGHQRERMRVFEQAVTWSCGAVRWLPSRASQFEARVPNPTGRMPRAVCPECGRTVALRNDKRLRGHGFGQRRSGPPCPGSGTLPGEVVS